jgi:hypothetical protein
MAYLRKERETVEMDYALDRVWSAVQKVVQGLEWSLEQIDDAAHHIKAKTRRTYMSWSSVVLIDAVSRGEKTTRVSVAAETPVTTITSLVYYGQARQLINSFLVELAKQLTT